MRHESRDEHDTEDRTLKTFVTAATFFFRRVRHAIYLCDARELSMALQGNRDVLPIAKNTDAGHGAIAHGCRFQDSNRHRAASGASLGDWTEPLHPPASWRPLPCKSHTIPTHAVILYAPGVASCGSRSRRPGGRPTGRSRSGGSAAVLASYPQACRHQDRANGRLRACPTGLHCARTAHSLNWLT